MALYTQLPIYKETYLLMAYLLGRINNVARPVRYTILQGTIDELTEITTMICSANQTRNRRPIISRMRLRFESVKVRLRLLADLHYISEKQFADISEHTASISKQMAAWEKKSDQMRNTTVTNVNETKNEQ